MAKRSSDEQKSADPTVKIANLLALVVTKGMPSGDQVICLSRAGFTYNEIADLVGTSPAVVRQTLYEERKGLRKKKKSKV